MYIFLDVTEIMTDAMLSYISDHANLIDSFVVTYAALMATLFNLVGLEFGAHLVQRAVEIYEKAIAEVSESRHHGGDGDDDDDDGAGTESSGSKRATNLATLVSYLYIFKVVSSPLLYGLLKACLARCHEVDVEIVLKMLRICGGGLRAEDPLSLKEIVGMVSSESGKGKPAFQL
jgi:nucleolar MIF4G domain-containing protein 1